jgi:hypothetical protein
MSQITVVVVVIIVTVIIFLGKNITIVEILILSMSELSDITSKLYIIAIFAIADL